MADPNAIYQNGETLEPVSPEHPLEGLETQVLSVWLENSPSLRKAHQANPTRVEEAVRQAVAAALAREAQLRAEGLAQHEAEEFTRPDLWKPPAVPTT